MPRLYPKYGFASASVIPRGKRKDESREESGRGTGEVEELKPMSKSEP